MTNEQVNDLETFNWGTSPIRIGHAYGRRYYELRPTELHLKYDGSLTDGASFVIGMEVPGNIEFYYGQVSLAMLQDAFSRLGYTLEKSTFPERPDLEHSDPGKTTAT